MTLLELAEEILSLPVKQQNMDVAVELIVSEEVFSSTNGDVDFEIFGSENSILDEGHPVISVNY